MTAYGASLLWFGAAAFCFTVGADSIMAKHVPAGVAAMDPATQAVASAQTLYAVRFVGGFNIGLAVLCAARLSMLLSERSRGGDGAVARWMRASGEWAILGACGIAHGSQFAFNTPPFATPQALTWTPLMSLIYATDFGMAALCGTAAVAAALASRGHAKTG